MQTLPNYVLKFLWDIDKKSFNPDKNKSFVIERSLEYGDLDAFNFVLKKYGKSAVINTLKTSKRISTKTGNFYALVLNINKDELECIKKPFTKKQNRF